MATRSKRTVGTEKQWIVRGVVLAFVGAVASVIVAHGIAYLNEPPMPAPIWAGHTWEESGVGVATLFKSAEKGSPVLIDGLADGRLSIKLLDENGDNLQGEIVGSAHGAKVGDAEIQLLANSQIGVRLSFSDGRKFELLFSREPLSASTADSNRGQWDQQVGIELLKFNRLPSGGVENPHPKSLDDARD